MVRKLTSGHPHAGHPVYQGYGLLLNDAEM